MRDSDQRMTPSETAAASAHLAPRPPHVPFARVVDIDLYSLPGSDRDFLASWKALQASTPYKMLWTPRNGGHWIVMQASDVARIYADHENFSSRITIVPREWGERYPLRPTTLDPPDHLKYRRVLTSVLSTATVQLAEPRIRALAAAAAERLCRKGHCEFMSEFAAGLPLALFAYLAEIPSDDTDVLPHYAEDPRDSKDSAGPEPIMDRFAAFLRAIVAQRRQLPGNDLISAIATSTVADRRIDADEAVELATAVMTGGLDTVVSTLGLMVYHLAQNDSLRRRLASAPAQIPSAVAGMLRKFPIMTKARLVRRDQEIDGVWLREGDMVVLPPLHDGADEDALSAGRSKVAHTTFGNGVHRCPGAFLAQRELEIMLQEWLARVPEFSLDAPKPARMQAGVLGAVLVLPLRWNVQTSRGAQSRT
jgi:cytochrome P450